MKRVKNILKILVIGFLVWYVFALPSQLFNVPYSTVIEDDFGDLLGAHIAKDEQWRFPKPDSLPVKYVNALLTYEDQQFYQHPGVNPVSLFQALIANVDAGRIKRGGSTITMQVIRMSRENPSRTIPEKLLEICLATRLELSKTKQEILLDYAGHAPYGGNVVGIEAACWRYFGKPLFYLTDAEYAMLAVLPNNPSLVHLGRNRKALHTKRNLLLIKMLEHELIDSLDCELAMAEPLPDAPHDLPKSAQHVLQRFHNDISGRKIKTTIQPEIQNAILHTLKEHQRKLMANHVYNVGVVVAEVESGKVVAYVGNGPSTPRDKESYVDVANAPRSTGSILKPFLFQSMLNEGLILPEMLVPDVPVFYNGFHPKNYHKSYDGAVPASLALTRSLNVPAVIMLREYGIEKFKSDLQQVGLTTLVRSSSEYGLSLILGGAEATLYELTRAYREIGLRAMGLEKAMPMSLQKDTFQYALNRFSPGAAYLTLETLKNLNRPSNEVSWKVFSGKDIAWKTGTSFGHRDAWSIGVTKEYVVGVWVGNANGEGRSILTGIDAAAPILFDVFAGLDKGDWFERPYGDTEEIELCKESGYPLGKYCSEKIQGLALKSQTNYTVCPYHKRVFVDEFEQYQVSSNCYEYQKMRPKYVFILPPLMETFYKKIHIGYEGLPPWKKGCGTLQNTNQIQFIYPNNYQTLVPTKQLDGNQGEIVFKAAHGNAQKRVYWHLDERYVGVTQHFHELPISLTVGEHQLTLIDEDGNHVSQKFNVRLP